MLELKERTVTTKEFDARNIRWNRIDGFDHIEYHVCDVDEANRSVDILFKFAANQKIVLHRHHADYRTLVLQGELRIYRRSEGDPARRQLRLHRGRRRAAYRRRRRPRRHRVLQQSPARLCRCRGRPAAARRRRLYLYFLRGGEGDTKVPWLKAAYAEIGQKEFDGPEQSPDHRIYRHGQPSPGNS